MITPFEEKSKLAEKIGSPTIYFKREDLHPYGSHKGRSIPAMIDHYASSGDRRFAISSSGNAALASALHVRHLNDQMVPNRPDNALSLDIFVGHNVSSSKLDRLKALTDENIRVLIKERPLQALTSAVQDGARSLRQSTDDKALDGYVHLGAELAESYKDTPFGSLFIGTSSGTTAQALAQYFIENKLPIQVHIVQTSSCHPIVDMFESYDGPIESSIADAIVDITGHRKQTVSELIKKTGGRGWFATNEDIRTAQELVRNHAWLEISTNSALSIVGAMRSSYIGHDTNGAIVCMICGE